MFFRVSGSYQYFQQTGSFGWNSVLLNKFIFRFRKFRTSKVMNLFSNLTSTTGNSCWHVVRIYSVKIYMSRSCNYYITVMRNVYMNYSSSTDSHCDAGAPDDVRESIVDSTSFVLQPKAVTRNLFWTRRACFSFILSVPSFPFPVSSFRREVNPEIQLRNSGERC